MRVSDLSAALAGLREDRWLICSISGDMLTLSVQKESDRELRVDLARFQFAITAAGRYEIQEESSETS